MKINTIPDQIPSRGLNAVQNTIFLKGHLSKHQGQNESIWIADVLINPFEGLKYLIKNKGKHGGPLKAMLPALSFL